jgi:hypothetical protein
MGDDRFVDRKVELVECRDVVLAVRIGWVESDRIAVGDQFGIGPPEFAVPSGVVDIPNKLLGDDPDLSR